MIDHNNGSQLRHGKWIEGLIEVYIMNFDVSVIIARLMTLMVFYVVLSLRCRERCACGRKILLLFGLPRRESEVAGPAVWSQQSRQPTTFHAKL
jgi:hypothetical protein